MTALKDKSPAEILLYVMRSEQTLKSALRKVVREHGDRIKRLRNIQDAITSTGDDAELDGMPKVSLSEADEKLILNPTGGL